MGWYDYLLMVICVIIIILSLLQGGKSEGASGAITGGGMNIFVKTKERGSELVITRITMVLGAAFFIICLVYSFM